MGRCNTLTATAYLLVTDLHLREGDFPGRHSYEAETAMVLNKIRELVKKYKDSGQRVVIIFMGDVYDKSFSQIFSSISYNNKIVKLRMEVDDMYALLGNHEFSFYKDNPFWTLLTEIESEKVKALLTKMWQPRGEMHTLSVVDELVDGDVRFIFNHNATRISSPPLDGKTNIGLFHQDLYAKAIAEDIEKNKGVKIFEHTPVYFDNSTVLDRYHYAFFGHMHMMYGKWVYKSEISGWETILYYLSTLGRTNHTEVIDTMLERNIPAVIVENGKFSRVEDNLFNLPSRAECVDEQVIEKAQQKRKEVKDRQELRNHVSVSDDPIVNIRNTLAAHPPLLIMFDQLVENGRTSIEVEVFKELEELSWL
jgi:hypothetical protein